MLAKIIDALRYHQIPFLEETGVAEMNQDSNDFTPKQYLIFRFLELINSILETDLMLFNNNL